MITKEEALQDLDIALRQIEFAFRVCEYVKLATFSTSDFNRELLVLLPEGAAVRFDPGFFGGIQAVHNAADVALVASFGVSALALDRALEVGGYRWVEPASDVPFQQLRSVVYQVRNAYAHSFTDPVWDVKREKRRAYTVTARGQTVVVDFVSLQGKRLDFLDIGGFAMWIKICEEVKRVLK